MVGTTVYCQGWGRNTFDTGFGTLRSATLSVTNSEGDGYRVGANASGQINWKGDSGSACFTASTGVITGVAVNCSTSGTTVNSCHHVGADSIRGWVSSVVGSPQVQRVEADFNGDGRKDVIIVTPSGS